MSDIYAKLSEPFPASVLRKNPKGMTYIAVSEVHARLNNALGVGNWSYEVINIRPHGEIQIEDGGVYPKWLVAHVHLSLNIYDPTTAEYSTVRRDGFGGQEVQFLKNGKGPVDIGDAYKGAVSDALKKAAQSAGVGLDIARTDEALEEEREAREAALPKADEVTIAAIRAAYGEMDESTKNEFKRSWGKISGGKKLEAGKVTIEEAEAVMAEFSIAAS